MVLNTQPRQENRECETTSQIGVRMATNDLNAVNNKHDVIPIQSKSYPLMDIAWVLTR